MKGVFTLLMLVILHSVFTVKPRVRLIQKKRSVSGWDGIICIVTGFYPRHINLTIFRDGEPVPERLITGGEPLPNGDGTYQMRKNLELRGEDLKQSLFTCNVTRLGLDNKLDVHLASPQSGSEPSRTEERENISLDASEN